MGDGRDVKLFEHLINILSDDEWHTIEGIANELSLSVESCSEFVIDLENAEVLQVEGDQYEKKNLVKGTSFVDSFLDLPKEVDS